MKKMVFKEVPEVVHNAVLNALDSLDEKDVISFQEKEKHAGRNIFHIPKIAVACMACFLLTGITASAVGFVNLYRQRLENMSHAQMEEYASVDFREMSRLFTEEESLRYTRLNDAYVTGDRFPESQLSYLPEGSVYDGNGAVLGTDTLYLPDRALTDEELLEIIDFTRKTVYSQDQLYREELRNGDGWESRMALMDDAEVDEIYRVMCSGIEETGGGYNRALSEEEQARYEELVKCYEEEGVYPTSEPTVILKPEDYTGEGIAVCIQDSDFYLPNMELSDDQLLQIIDYEHKLRYCLNRINYEIMWGWRDGYPPRADFE